MFRQGICVLAGNWLMGSTQSRVGNAPSQTGCLSQVGSPGTGIGPLFNTIMSDLDGGTWCALVNFADGVKLSGEVNLKKGEPPWKKFWMGWKSGLMRALAGSAKTNTRSCMWENMIQESEIFVAGKQLCGNGPGDPGGFSSVKMSCVLLWQRETVGCWIAPTRTWSTTQELSLHSTQGWPSHTWNICMQFWCPLNKKDVARLERVQRRAAKMIKGLRSWSVKNNWEILACSALRKEGFGDVTSMFQYLKGTYKEDGHSIFTRSYSDKI